MPRGARWIQEAIKHSGVLRARAEREGAITNRGEISVTWLKRIAAEGGIWASRARLALTLRGLNE